jgi:hypothetical protein
MLGFLQFFAFLKLERSSVLASLSFLRPVAEA